MNILREGGDGDRTGSRDGEVRGRALLSALKSMQGGGGKVQRK